MKIFVIILLWVVFLGSGFWMAEWAGLIVGWIILTIGFTAVTESFESAFNTLLNICLAICLTSVMAVLSFFILITFPQVPVYIMLPSYIGTFYILFRKLYLK